MQTTNLITAFAIGVLLSTQGQAEDQVAFQKAQVLSQEMSGGALPGGAAAKGKLVRLFKTPQAVHDGRLVVAYADANNTEQVWDPKGGQHAPNDIYVRYSDDEGDSWSDPVNISNTARSFSAASDWNGDGSQELYWGHSEKPNVFSSGNVIVVSWIDAYVPEATWAWGANAISEVQGRVNYPDLEVYPNTREVPYHGVYLAISYDGGTSWAYGSDLPPVQLTYGRRDAKQDVNRGAGKKWIVSWQEDPEGLQRGEADGPGDGASGATASKGTDIWFTWVADISADPLSLRTHRRPLTDHSSYDVTNHNGFPLTTVAGDVDNHAATRANTHIINDGGVFKALVAYEETKGIEDVLEGKTIQYHCFPYSMPPLNGIPTATFGGPGVTLTGILTNSRRARFVRQPANGTDPALFIFWREGVPTEGGSADIMGKLSLALDEATVAAAPSLNFSTNTPSAIPADMLLDSESDPLENALAHRAIMRGDFIAIGYTYTWNGPLQRFTDLANLDFWIRCTTDGGLTWSAPQNLSALEDTTINVKEPRLVYTVNSGFQDDNVFIAAWGTETNVYEGVTSPEPLDVMFTRSSNKGLSFEKVVPVAKSESSEYESQLRINDDGTAVYSVVMSSDALGKEAMFTRGRLVQVPESVGTLSCFGDELVAACPCGNPTPIGMAAGCANSTGLGGRLIAGGSASIVENDLHFEASDLPPMDWAVLAMGTGVHSSFTGYDYGAGLWCASGTLIRMDLQLSSASGDIVFGPALPGLNAALMGETRIFQVAYRDPAGACSGLAYNATNSVEITFVP